MAIGQRIKYFRNRIGMTQKQLGEKLGGCKFFFPVFR